MGGMSFLDMLNAMAVKESMTKDEFGEIMRNGTFEEKKEAVRVMNEAGGYENLGD